MNRTGTERARAVVTDRLGWTGNALDSVRLESAIHSCAAGLQQTRESYLERVERGSAPELRALVAQLAVGETYFFRDRAQFAVLDRLLERASSPLRVLCAGCASGEEPYSIAIRMLERGARGHVLGIDVNAPAIDLARKAVYSAWSLRDTPQATIDAWFHPEGKRFALSQAPKDLVELRHANLYADTLADLGQWDLVLCRNVLMYHSRPAAAEIVSKLSRQLVPGGYLFLGHAETLRGISDEFELHQAAGTFFYRRLGGPPSPPERISNRPAPATADDSWIDAIGSATDRIAALARGATSTQTPDKSDWMQMIREHVEAGAPLAALGLIEAIPAGDRRRFEIVRAGLLLMAGRGDEAQSLAETLAQKRESLPEAHYVIALCESQAGHPEAALKRLELVHQLDPEFAMPLVQAGLHLRRLGNATAGQQQLELAHGLLEQESAERLLLFGGGFSRGALQRICNTQRRNEGEQ